MNKRYLENICVNTYILNTCIHLYVHIYTTRTSCVRACICAYMHVCIYIENQIWGLKYYGANLARKQRMLFPTCYQITQTFKHHAHYPNLHSLTPLTHSPHLSFFCSAANSCPTSPRGGHGGLGGLGGNKRVNAENLVQAAYAAMEDKGDIANTGWQLFWVQGLKSLGKLQ